MTFNDMKIRIAFKKSYEILELKNDKFYISKGHNEDFEKSIDPFNGKEIIPNRYECEVSALWVIQWLKKRGKEEIINKFNNIKDLAFSETKIIDLLECMIDVSSKQMFTEVLKHGKDKHLLKFKSILKKLKDNNLFIKFINHSHVVIFNSDFSKNKNVINFYGKEGDFSMITSGFSYCSETRILSFSETFLKKIENAIRFI